MGQFVDLTGKKQGSLTVIKSLKETNSSGSRYWACKCDCGKEFRVSSSAINAGVKSCGCIARRKFVESNIGKPSNNLKPNGQSNSKIVYRSYKDNAKKRGLQFDITLDVFLSLSSKNCHYCGEPPSQVIRAKYAKCNGVYLYNGLDRLDNNQGYVIGNLVPCCKVCNRAKFKMTPGEFTLWVIKTFKHLTK